MKNKITVLNFDNIYQSQSFLNKDKYNWIDLQSIPNTNLLCEKNTLSTIAKQLDRYKSNKITLIGSGNYHYITYLLLSKMRNPFTLVLFDHHTDTLKSPSDQLISCGSWVVESLQNLPNLKKVVIIGISEEGKQHIPSSIEGKISLYSKHYLRLNFTKSIEDILKDIPTQEVYISIDKDVLDKRDALTAWDHGNMRLRKLLKIVHEIMKDKAISGIDLCGEYPSTPSNEFERQTKEANKKNSYANQFLLHFIGQWLERNQAPSHLLHA